MTEILAIDPGNEQSAYVVYHIETGRPSRFNKLPNSEMLDVLDGLFCDTLAIEMIASYGMAVGATTFDTCVWIGRFIERWGFDKDTQLVFRREVKSLLCGSQKAKDGNIRQALIDRYGPSKEQAVGKKASPGPLYGISGDVWSALAIAVTVAGRESRV